MISRHHYPLLQTLVLLAAQRDYPMYCWGFSQQPHFGVHRSSTSTLLSATTLQPSDRSGSETAFLEDDKGHINPELAQRIFKWEREQHVSADVRSGYSTREGLRWVQDLVGQTAASASKSVAASGTPGSATDDLIQEGVIALMQAMTTYENESRPMQSFESFAKERIQRALEDYLVTSKLASSTNSRKSALSVESTVEIADPLETHYSNQDEWEVREGLVLDNGQGVKPEELVEEFLDETLQYEGEDQMWVHQQQVAAPLRDSIPSTEADEAAATWLDAKGSREDLSLDDMALRDMILYDVDEFLGNTLDEMESQVIQLRFGLDSDTPKTLKEVAFELGLTVSRVRKLQKQALEKLRSSYTKQYIDDDVDMLLEDSV